jgi:hypothetical protein
MSYSGGWQDIDDVVATDWLLIIDNATKITDFILKLAIDVWKTDAQVETADADVKIGTTAVTSTAAVTQHVNGVSGATDAPTVTGTNSDSSATGTIAPITPAGSATSGAKAVTVTGDNNPGYCQQSASAQIVTVTLDSESTWYDLGEVTDTKAMGAFGRSFGILSVQLIVSTINSTTDTGCIEFMFLYPDGTNILGTSYYPILIIPHKLNTQEHVPVSLSVLFGYANPEPSVRIIVRGRLRAGWSSPNVSVKASTINITKVGGHDHPATSTHGHDFAGTQVTPTISSATAAAQTFAGGTNVHVYTPSVSDHGHSVTDSSGHVHNAPASHAHSVAAGSTSLTGYPSNINIYLYNSAYPSGVRIGHDAGGSQKTITLADCASKLASGDNWFEIESDSIGSGWLSGTYYQA